MAGEWNGWDDLSAEQKTPEPLKCKCAVVLICGNGNDEDTK